ncbi:4-hydroxybenzoyl-CoA thioesterase [Devosia enhydra]|uniref:4-hydroxybenzoyl-CoA thioesterase n=1 Tax=Devosia enhydra TaxID=665118 RepID=A0A1K2HT41_9HYPH|nr:thioesterase family protein [Devosia enhydra]SFZ81222.1 4-hydroxybenzoyl-CoA thioesterase [Devosia enhydra]
MFINRFEVEIQFGDCDPAGIVFYPNYFRFFDAATAKLFEAALGEKKIAWTKRFGVLGIPMVDTGAKFMKPSRFGDVVTIETEITGLKRSSFTLVHRLYNGGALCIEGHEVRVLVGPDPDAPGGIKSLPMPPEMVAALTGEITA